jgi:hypothetical protein
MDGRPTRHRPPAATRHQSLAADPAGKSCPASPKPGVAEAKFIGRFSNLTFSVAPGTAAAPHVDGADGEQNPAFTPIHQQHLGLWFTSPADATAAGCPGATTPFNATHDAGVQVLNTSTFPDLDGPLDELPGQQ